MQRAVRWLVFIAMLGCGAAQHAPRAEPARIRWVIDPDTARVYTDGHYVGMARALRNGYAFAVGPRQFVITADGYFPHDLMLDLPSGESTINIRLRPIPQ